jgi:hypothetical protein
MRRRSGSRRTSKRSGSKRSGRKRSGSKRSGSKRSGSKRTKRHMKKMWGGELSPADKEILKGYLAEVEKYNSPNTDQANAVIDQYFESPARRIVGEENPGWSERISSLEDEVKILLNKSKPRRTLPDTPIKYSNLPETPSRSIKRSSAIKGERFRAPSHSARKSPTGTSKSGRVVSFNPSTSVKVFEKGKAI